MVTPVSPQLASETVIGTGSASNARLVGKDKSANRDWLPAVGLIGPNIVMYTVFISIPILFAIFLSFTTWGLVGAPHFVGLANYREMFNDPMVLTSIVTTLLFLAFGVIPTVVLGLLLAMLINYPVRFITALRTLYFVPAVVSFAAS